MPALERAIALIQVDDVAVGVREHLHLEVPGVAHQLLDEHLVLAEGRARLATGRLDLLGQLVDVVDHAHAAAAAAPARLEHDGQADGLGDPPAFVVVVGQRRGGGHDRDVGLLRQMARGHLGAELLHDVRWRADEGDPGVGAGPGELRVLGEKAVTRVDGVHARIVGDLEDARHVQIGAHGFVAFAHHIALVRLEAVEGEAVLVRIDRHSLDAQFARRAEDANGDLTPVGDEQLVERPQTGLRLLLHRELPLLLSRF